MFATKASDTGRSDCNAMSDRQPNAYTDIWFQLFLESIGQERTESEVAFLARLLPNPPYSKVLDLCCGEGRHSLPLANLGYEVTGLDFSAFALEKARLESGNRVRYLELDMRNLDTLPYSFDAMICLWQSFGYFDKAQNSDILRQISLKLNSGGRFVLDIYNRGFFENHQGSETFEINGIKINSTSRIENDRLTVRLDYGDDRGGDAFEWQVFTPDEIRSSAGKYGLSCLVVCTDYAEEKSATPDVPRMQLVFEKEKVE